jgi:protein-S-isoprenylcysteine O-methyltransferase Ste14
MRTSYILKHVVGSTVFFLIIFISAGKLNYWQGLVYAAIGLLMSILSYTVLSPDPGLLAERGKPGEGSKKWDKSILLLSFVITLSMYIIAGFDSGRYHWSPDFPSVLSIVGAVLTITGQFLFLLAQKQNKFFSSTVRIQTDRNHVVCSGGLYSIIRHPGYMGSIIQAIGFPLLFESLWSIIPVSLLIVIQIIRTHMEDKTLKDELKGYTEYASNIKYRLIPYVY